MLSALSSAPAPLARLASPPAGKPAEPAAGVEPPARVSRPYGPAVILETSAAKKSSPGEASPRDPEALSEEEQRQVQKLRQSDAKVRAHEGAHSAAGGGYTGATSYEFTTGPDGKRYAIGGEVQIDASPVRDNPAATVAKMDIIIRAALAPAEPSSQDQAVARDAAKARSQAQTELQKQTETENSSDKKPPGAPTEPPPKPGEENDTSHVASANQLLTASRAYADQSANIQQAAASIFSAAAQVV